MLKRFFRDAIIYAVPTFLARAVGIILLPIYARELGPADLGFVDFLAAASVFLLLLVPMEINQALARMLPETEDASARASLILSALAFTGLAFAVAGVALVLGRFAILDAMSVSRSYSIYILPAAVYYFVLALVACLQVQFRFSHQALASSVMNIAIVLANMAAVISFSITYRLDINLYLFSQILANAFGILVAIVFVVRQFRGVTIVIGWKLIAKMLRYSLPLMISSFGVALSASLDRILLAKYVGLKELGYYGISLRLASIITTIFYVTGSTITPIVYKDFGRPEAVVLLRRIFTYVALTCFAVLLGATFFSNLIVNILAGPQFSQGAQYVFFVVFVAILSNFYIFFMGMDLAKNTKLIGKINLAMGGIGAALSIVLIPVLGAWGAVISGMVAATFRIISYAWFSHRLFPVRFPLLACAISLLALLAFNLFGFLGAGLNFSGYVG